MPDAARLGDSTQHGNPLAPGTGSPDVLIGMKPAWRALPAAVGAAIEAASKAMDKFMKEATLTPASAGSKIAKNAQGLIKSGAKGAAEGNPAGIAAASTGVASVVTANIALTATWTTASAAPGGQPAATKAYTEGIKAISATAATAVFSAVGGLADTHICPIPCPVPPHGPGMVAKGSKSVFINNLPAARKGDKVMEACGGADPIAMGCPTVLIGDKGGGGGAGGGGAGGKSGGAAGKKSGVTAKTQDKSGEAGGPTSASIQSMGVTCECSNPDCAAAFQSAADDGTPLVDRETHGCAGPPDRAERVVGSGVHWIEIELVGEDDEGIPGERFLLKTADGKEISGVLGEDGRMRFDGLEQAGPCRITFPDLDQDACEEIV